MAVGGAAILNLAAGALDIALALYLLKLNFADRANRAFAVFLTLTGGLVCFGELADVVPALAWLSAVVPYYALPDIFAVLWFAAVYPRPTSLTRRAWSAVPFAAAAIFVDAWYLADHAAYGPGGWLRLFDYWTNAIFPLMGLIFAWRASREREIPTRASLILVSLGFGMIIFTADVYYFTRVVTGDEPFDPRYDLRWVLDLAMGAATAFLLVRMARATDPEDRRAPRAALALLAIGAIVGLVEPPEVLWVGPTVDGVWRLLLPAMVSYALVKHQLFGIDLKLKRALHASLVAGVFLLVFLVVEQIAQSYLTAQYGSLAGAAAAALLLFALRPLQRAADRLTDATMPRVRPYGALDHGARIRVYRDQALLAWQDGALDRKERQMLDGLRIALGLATDETAAIEAEVVSVGSGP